MAGATSSSWTKTKRPAEHSGALINPPARLCGRVLCVVLAPFDTPIIMSGMRILVVEDDEKIASFVVKGLKQAGYAVDRSADGEEGWRLAQTVTYDAAVIASCFPNSMA